MNIKLLGMSTEELKQLRGRNAERLVKYPRKLRELDWLIASRELYENNGINCVARFK